MYTVYSASARGARVFGSNIVCFAKTKIYSITINPAQFQKQSTVLYNMLTEVGRK